MKTEVGERINGNMHPAVGLVWTESVKNHFQDVKLAAALVDLDTWRPNHNTAGRYPSQKSPQIQSFLPGYTVIAAV